MQLHLPLTLVGAMLLGAATPAAADVPTTGREITEVFFETDSANLSGEAALSLNAAAKKLKCACKAKIFLGGFTDPRGSAPYNVGLSIRRAEAVRDYLAALGISQDRIILGFYGEDAPRRDTFARERRVSIGLTYDPLHQIVDDTLTEATAIVWSKPVTAAELEGSRPIPVATR